jgi:hypothetical protein
MKTYRIVMRCSVSSRLLYKVQEQKIYGRWKDVTEPFTDQPDPVIAGPKVMWHDTIEQARRWITDQAPVCDFVVETISIL